MTFKKKTMVSLCMVAITFVLAIFGVVGIFAISNVKVVTNMSVTYTSNVVGAMYGLSYSNRSSAFSYIERDVSLSSAGSNDVVVTSSDMSNDYTQLDTTSNTYCIWRWEFKNTGSNPFTATLVYEDTGVGDVSLTINRKSSTSSSAGSLSGIGTTSLGSQTYFDNVTVNAGTTMYFFVQFTIDTKTQYAEFSGKFSWTLAVAEAVA